MWRARLIARETTDLSVEAALFADRLIAATPRQDRAGAGRPARPGGPALLRPRPRHRRRGRSPRQARRLAAPQRRTGHHRHHDDPGHPRRAALRPDHHPPRRRPQGARRHRDPRRPPRARRRDPRRPPARPGPAQLAARVQRPASAPAQAPANLYVHLTPADLDATSRRHRCCVDREARRRHHPAAHRLAHPLRRSRRQDHPAPGPRPQLRLAVDQHDPPEAMRETVVLRDAHCVFPGCRRDSRACDLDHITEYLPMEDGGPPGQTRPGNLAPLCRTHHRVEDPLRRGTTSASTTGATRGPRPPAISTTSCPPHG